MIIKNTSLVNIQPLNSKKETLAAILNAINIIRFMQREEDSIHDVWSAALRVDAGSDHDNKELADECLMNGIILKSSNSTTTDLIIWPMVYMKFAKEKREL